MKSKKMRPLIFAAFFAAVIFLGTYIIKIPIPNGYIHFGDGFIYIAAMLLPISGAAAAAAIGGLLSDVLAGFVAYAPCTAVIKLLMAVAVGLFAMNLRRQKELSLRGNLPRLVCGVVLAGVINVGGYFLADWVMFGFAAALPALPMNALQSLFGAVIFFIFLPIIKKAFSHTSTL